MVLAASDPHRDYYEKTFRGAGKREMCFAGYVGNLGLLILISSLIVLVVLAYNGVSFKVAIAALIMFLSEKLYDEILRFQLFAKNFSEWSKIILFKVVAVHGTSVFFWILKNVINFDLGFNKYILLSSIIVFLVLTVTADLKGFFARNFKNSWKTYTKILLRQIKCIRYQLYQLLKVSILGQIAYVDRVLIMFIDKASLPGFTLLTMCFGFIQQSIDVFYISQIRSELLQSAVDGPRMVFNVRVAKAVISGLFLSSCALLFSLFILKKNILIHPVNVFLCALIHTVIGLSAIVQQLVYWNNSINESIKIEGRFLLALLIFLALLNSVTIPLSLGLVVLNVLVVYRFVCYFYKVPKTEFQQR